VCSILFVQGNIPAELGDLESLKELLLADNELTGTLLHLPPLTFAGPVIPKCLFGWMTCVLYVLTVLCIRRVYPC
jgi:hypothetical protein